MFYHAYLQEKFSRSSRSNEINHSSPTIQENSTKSSERTALLAHHKINIQPPQIENIDFIPLPVKRILLKEIEECLAILEQAQINQLPKNTKKQHQAYRFCLLLCWTLILLNLGMVSGAFAYMWVFMDIIFAQAKISWRNTIANKESTAKWVSAQLIHLQNNDTVVEEEIVIAANNMTNAENMWGNYFDSKGNGCNEWTNAEGQKVSVYQEFPNFSGDYCYFTRHQHPIAECNTIAKMWCYFYNELFDLIDEDSNLQQEIQAKQSRLNDLDDQISSLLNHPPSKTPSTNGILMLIGAAGIAAVLTIVIICCWCKKRPKFRDEMLFAESVAGNLSPSDINRIYNLAERLPINDFDTMSLPIFINLLQETKQSIRGRMQVAHLFFNQIPRVNSKGELIVLPQEMKLEIAEEAALITHAVKKV